ncbi:MAG: hypothetical protein ACI8TP_000396 [Acidimicrobiales bacterium]|jgi:hypothetical protein
MSNNFVSNNLVTKKEAPLKRRQQVEALSTGEAVAAAAIMLLWCLVPLVIGMPVLMALLLAAIGLGLLWTALLTGSYLALSISLLYASVLTAISFAESDALGLGVAPPALASLFVLGDLVRVAYARRRASVVSDRLLRSALAGSLGVGLLTSASTAMIWLVGDGAEGVNWLWTPIAASVLIVLLAVLVVAQARRAIAADRRRWTPGEHVPQPPTHY